MMIPNNEEGLEQNLFFYLSNLKKDCNVDYTNWDGRLIHTVSSIDVNYMLCETIPDLKRKKQINLN